MSGSPRLPLLSAEEAREAAAAAGVPEALARLNVFRALLRHPALARRLADVLLTLMGEARLDPRLRELAIMRIGWVTGSDYEWTQHWRIAGSLGIPEADLAAVRDWHAHEGFSASDRAVLMAVDEVLEDGAVSAPTWAGCVNEVDSDPEVLLELLTAIGLWRMVSSLLRSLEIPLEDGMASWPPDGSGRP